MHNTFGYSHLKVYPSGFLGAPQEPILIRNVRSSDNVRLTYDASIFDPEKEDLVIANQEIDKYYKMLARGDVRSSNFDFREKALKSILRCFGTDSFNAWVYSQFSSPVFDSVRRSFIDDCLEFTWSGNRSMSNTMWSAIITSPDDGDKVNEISERMKSYFRVESLQQLIQVEPRNNISIVEAVNCWMKQPRGFDDLLETCHLMFGIGDNI